MKLNAAARLLAHKVEEKWVPGVRGYHNAAGAIIMAADTGRCNLQLRSSTSDTPNTYGSWGGSMDNNEEQAAATRREIEEETGYSGRLRLIPLMTSVDPDRGFTYYNHLAIVPSEFEPQINHESGGHRWFTVGSWPPNLHPGLKSVLEDTHSSRILRDAARGRFGDQRIQF